MGRISLKKRRLKGFTLAELLVVVAIVAVLVAISIPIFTSQLEKSRKAVDLSNVRSAKAAAAAEYMTTDMTGEVTYYYDAATGKVTDLATARAGVEGYGKSHSAFDPDTDGASGTPNTGSASGVVAVTVNADGSESARWELKGLVEVTSSNVNDYVVKNADGMETLEFGQGSLSYLYLGDGKVLKDVSDKADVTSIIFGRNNTFKEEDNPLNNGDTNKGVNFGRDNDSALIGYNNLKKIDFSGITIASVDFSQLQQHGLAKLNTIVLPDQDELKFDVQGSWYYMDSNGNKVSLNTNSGVVNKSNARVDTTINAALKGATIYKEK
jgi:prepilin-type N-terminal cleavage/methylation domain-containing protein